MYLVLIMETLKSKEKCNSVFEPVFLTKMQSEYIFFLLKHSHS